MWPAVPTMIEYMEMGIGCRVSGVGCWVFDSPASARPDSALPTSVATHYAERTVAFPMNSLLPALASIDLARDTSVVPLFPVGSPTRPTTPGPWRRGEGILLCVPSCALPLYSTVLITTARRI